MRAGSDSTLGRTPQWNVDRVRADGSGRTLSFIGRPVSVPCSVCKPRLMYPVRRRRCVYTIGEMQRAVKGERRVQPRQSECAPAKPSAYRSSLGRPTLHLFIPACQAHTRRREDTGRG